MPYVKDEDHCLRVEIVHTACKPDAATKQIDVQLSTAAGLQAVSLMFDSKAKRDEFWALLYAALT